ncbi:MAG: DUF6290 family protein [Peptostreptococcaceae bacterium]|nr:DUF6290 family protein [Peptostreptococcaceae bacterium]
MPIVRVHLNNEEMKIMRKFARKYRGRISTAIKSLAFEKIEDDHDLQVVLDYERRVKNGDVKYYTSEEFWKIVGMDDDE